MADPKVPHQDPEYKLYVYVIESEAGVVKVGFSGDPQARLLNLLTGHPFGLEVVYTKSHELAASPIAASCGASGGAASWLWPISLKGRD